MTQCKAPAMKRLYRLSVSAQTAEHLRARLRAEDPFAASFPGWSQTPRTIGRSATDRCGLTSNAPLPGLRGAGNRRAGQRRELTRLLRLARLANLPRPSLRFHPLRWRQVAFKHIAPGFFVVLPGSLAPPLRRLGYVLIHASATEIHAAEVALRLSIPLIGRLAPPLHRLGIVLRHASAIGIQEAEFGLRLGIAFISLGARRGDLLG